MPGDERREKVVSDLPQEAQKLLATAPDEFVPQRQALVRELREAGRSEDASVVAQLRKPSAVVLAVNRAARARPNAARAAAEAAERVKRTQVGGDPDEYRRALDELDESLDLLAEVAAAHVAPRGKSPSEAMRRRVRGLLRSAVADDDAREELRSGVLREEQEAAGFSPFAGLSPKPVRRKHATGATEPATKRAEKHRKQVQALRDELASAEQELKDAERSVREAERARSKAERAVSALRARLDRLA